jgi:class 3 adenylate cyclase
MIPYGAGTVVAFLLSIEATRIPFRRTYHLLLAIVTMVGGAYYADRAIAAAANTPAAYHPLSVLALYLFPLQLALAYHFFVAYTNPQLGRLLRYSLIASYLVMLIFWLILLVDQPLLIPGAVRTPLGLLADAPGPAEVLIFLYWSALIVASGFLLLRFYVRLPANVVKRQTRYLVLGSVLVEAGTTTLVVARDIAIPPLDWLLAPVGVGVVLLGFRKHGFASVTAAKETQSPTAPVHSIPVGRSYLLMESGPEGAFEAFADLIRHGHQGLCITRTHPENVRQAYDMEQTPVRWLAQSVRDDAIAPEDLIGLSMVVKSFLQVGTNPVVLLHGVEYLVTNNGFKPTLTLLQRLNDVIAEQRGILLLPIVPGSLSWSQEALISSEFTRLPRLAAGSTAQSKGTVVGEGRGNATIMFADIVGYSAMVQEDEKFALAILDDEQRLVRAAVQERNGREVKSLGDGLLVEFDDPRSAVLCATKIQDAIEKSNSKLPRGKKVMLRIGIHVGEVVYKDGDILGDTVNIASRIEAMAGPGETWLSQRVYEQVRDKLDSDFIYLGQKEMRNIAMPVGVYRLGMDK